MRPTTADGHKQATLGRWALRMASISVVLGALVALSGCDRTIENTFRGACVLVERRDGAVVKLAFAFFSDDDLKKLKGMADLRSLEELGVEGPKITDAGLVYIKDCRNLKLLTLNGTAITDDGLAQLEPLSALQYLSLAGTRISDRGLKHIERLGNLEFLVLMKNNISDEGAKHLENLHKLKTLYANGTHIGDRGLQSIAHLHELRFLSLTGAPVGDRGVAHLTSLHNLQSLDLDKTNVTDDALPAIQRLTNLTFLDLMGTRVTQRGVAQLRRALPKTRIAYEAHPDWIGKLRDIAAAMQRYHESHGNFPAAYTVDKQGQPLLSWRVQLLPLLGQGELYKQFHLDEPWDSQHNQTLIEKIPEVYHWPGPTTGRTNYLVPVGKATAFPGSNALGVRDITDGCANTIMVVERDDDHAVLWTKPEDLPFDAAGPAGGLSALPKEGFWAVMCDGSVRWIPKEFDAKSLRAAFTRAGGEAIEWCPGPSSLNNRSEGEVNPEK